MLKTLFTALVLSTAPVAALAAGCSWMKDTTAASCAEGMVWDSESQRCVEQTTS